KSVETVGQPLGFFSAFPVQLTSVGYADVTTAYNVMLWIHRRLVVRRMVSSRGGLVLRHVRADFRVPVRAAAVPATRVGAASWLESGDATGHRGGPRRGGARACVVVGSPGRRGRRPRD